MVEDRCLELSRKLAEDGKVEEALNHLLSGLNFLKNDKQELKALYCFEIVLCYGRLGNSSCSITYYNKSLKIYQELKILDKEVSVLFNLSNQYKLIHEYKKAFNCAINALEKGERIFTDDFKRLLSMMIHELKELVKEVCFLENTSSKNQIDFSNDDSFINGEEDILSSLFPSPDNIILIIKQYNKSLLDYYEINEGHMLLDDLLAQSLKENEFREYIESALAAKNYVLFSGLYNIRNRAKEKDDFFIFEYLESIAGLHLYFDSVYINPYNLELISDTYKLLEVPKDKLIKSNKFKRYIHKHKKLMTYWRIKYFADLAFIKLEENDSENAEKLLEICQYFGKNSNNIIKYLDYVQGKLNENTGNHENAIKLYEGSIQYFNDNSMPYEHCTIMLELAQLYNKISNAALAISCANACLDLVEQINNTRFLISCYLKLGVIYFQSNQYFGAIICFENYNNYKKDKLNNKIGSVYTLLIQSYFELENHDSALNNINEAIFNSNICDENKLEILDMLGQFGWQCVQSNINHTAIKYLELGLELSKITNEKEKELSCLDILGYAYTNLNEYEKAIPLYIEAVILAKNLNQKSKAIDYMTNLGVTYDKIINNKIKITNIEELSKSINCFQEVEPFFDELNKFDQKNHIISIFSSVLARVQNKEFKDKYTKIILNKWEDEIHFLGSDFKIFKRINGGMGEILFGAKNDPPFQAYAIKKIKSEMSINWAFKEQFMIEAQILVELENHPNIVNLRFVRKFNEDIYLFFEFVIGAENKDVDLSVWIKKSYLDLPQSLKFAINICDGMDYVFNKFKERQIDFSHLDIKPSNILIDKDGIAKVSDFGLAKLQYNLHSMGINKSDISTYSSVNVIGGTAPYMSPEQSRKENDCDIRSDIYSFGCLFYEMLTGNRLFKAFDDQTYIYRIRLDCVSASEPQSEPFVGQARSSNVLHTV